ncbi:MAG: hypothetical protein GX950_02120 [Candidatus Diapherotrites archaeon]|uniref:Uncharacterized protein n=1 Tax=Candidatus Iainarchaeum sp. TaxID=3101447 RepID=A0A7K4BZB7_9ARCH|nr:hypothetical protein [Candidatus Diapherotrites archaeon]
MSNKPTNVIKNNATKRRATISNKGRFPRILKFARKSRWVSTTTKKPMGREVALSGPALATLRKNPGLIRAFFRARKYALRPYGKGKSGDVVVERLTDTSQGRRENKFYQERTGSGFRQGRTGSEFYKVTYKGRSFFAKEYKLGKTGELFIPEYDLPSAQRKAMKKTKEFLRKNKRKYPDFVVANFQLAYTGRSNALFVTDYYDLIPANKYLMPTSEKTSQQRARIEILAGELIEHGIGDVHTNTFYSPSLKKFVIVDMRDVTEDLMHNRTSGKK